MWLDPWLEGVSREWTRDLPRKKHSLTRLKWHCDAQQTIDIFFMNKIYEKAFRGKPTVFILKNYFWVVL